jgi:alanyl-tRNA synthetase
MTDSLKKLCFELKNDLTNYVVVLAANVDGKAQVAVLLDEAVSAAKNLEAPKIIKEQVAGLIKGGGGGQKTLATAGGQDASNLQQVIEKVTVVPSKLTRSLIPSTCPKNTSSSALN